VAVSPVAVEINGDSWGLLNYGGGIYDPTGDCNDYDINHSVTIIGFDYQIDFDEYGNPYNTTFFQAVNSFGSSWG
jgi:C1A family cysteine protease